MFKKKNELPPWPKPPTNDQMLEDITSAPPDDPVFSGKQVIFNFFLDHFTKLI